MSVPARIHSRRWTGPVFVRDIRRTSPAEDHSTGLGTYRLDRTRTGVLTPWIPEPERATADPQSLEAITGVGAVLSNRLVEHGYASFLDVALADLEELTAVRGIGSISGGRIRASAETLVGSDDLCGLDGETLRYYSQSLRW